MDKLAQPSQLINLASKNEQDDEDLEGPLLLIQEIVVSVQKDVDMDSLEAAVFSLQDALDKKPIAEDGQVMIYRHLIKALLVRYGLHGWIEDLDACLQHLTQGIGAQRIIKLLCPESDDDTAEVLLAAELINACQNSIDIVDLDTVVCIATEVLSSCPGDKSTPQIASLWIILGKVRVMKFLKNGKVGELNQATRAFQQAKLLCKQDSTLLYICLMSLSHAEWLRFVERREIEGIGQSLDYWAQSLKIDEEGRNLSETGTRMTQNAVDDAQLQNGIALLKASLRYRKEAHPRRWRLLCDTARALHARFEGQGILEDLKECIALYREALHLHPPPHPNRSTSLNHLASALCTYFQHIGNFQDLEECITLYRESLGLRPPPHPNRCNPLNNLANALAMRFDHKGEYRDIDECIKLHREGLQLHPRPHPDRSGSLNNLANDLSTRFKHKGTFEDLEECITLHREALALQPAPHPDRSWSLNNLANALSARFDSKGALDDLEECITLHREALSLRPPTHPYRPGSLNNLANAICTRFENKGAFGDLDECISLYQEALVLRPPHHPGRPMLLNNLSGALFIRFEHKGTPRDLEESIKLQREGLALRPLSHADRPGSLNNLASALSTRFNHNGSFEDLEECIKLHREALDLMAPPHLDRFLSLNNLASALSTRFDHKGAFEDLEECINLHREALDAAPLSHSKRSELFNSLAVALLTRFDQKGEFQDLEECINFHREAISLRTWSHPDRSGLLNNLANALHTRFDHQGSFEDLDECLALGREALDLRPPSHPDRHMSLASLAHALYTRFDHKGLLQDLEECVVLRREELALQPPTHSNYSMALNSLACALQARFKFKGVIQDLDDCIGLHRKALDLQPAPHRYRPGSLNNLATALSTHFEHKGAFENLEESIALHREALALRPQPHPDRPAALNSLATALFTHFERKGTFEDLEEAITLYQEALNLQPPPHPDRSMSLNNLANALSRRFEHKGVSQDIRRALDYLEEATRFPTGSLIKRLNFLRNWVKCSQRHFPTSTLAAYDYFMELLPQLASLDLTLQQRQDVLQHTQKLVGSAAKCAIEADKCDVAVTYLSTGRSVFWAQALQLRTPADELMVTHPIIAGRFVSISQRLENASYSERTSGSSLLSGEGSKLRTYTSLHILANQRRKVLDEIRKIPGYESFLLPSSFSSLQPAAKDKVIVLLNGSPRGCDALIMQGMGQVQLVPLPNVPMELLGEIYGLLPKLLNARARFIEVHQNTIYILRQLLGRDMVLESSLEVSSEDTFRSVLGYLWVRVVEPVVKELGIKKTDSPRRIWWCPTGPFASLPIHAAGIYSDNNKPLDCLFQYAVSSYCTSLHDLLYLPPKMPECFKMTAVIEPEAPNAAALPATVKELKKIKNHVPDQQSLTTHVGSKESPNQVDDLVSDIQESSFVHFGCHGMQNLKDPLESYLHLSGGRLTMSKIIRECRVPEGALAYLSACETAKGDEVRPDESLNLVATMMFAGFRSVVGTMWSILDEDAPVVADVFYRHLFRNGKETPPDVRDAAYGLHLATKELRERGKSFYSWVPYVHYGI